MGRLDEPWADATNHLLELTVGPEPDGKKTLTAYVIGNVRSEASAKTPPQSQSAVKCWTTEQASLWIHKAIVLERLGEATRSGTEAPLGSVGQILLRSSTWLLSDPRAPVRIVRLSQCQRPMRREFPDISIENY